MIIDELYIKEIRIQSSNNNVVIFVSDLKVDLRQFIMMFWIILHFSFYFKLDDLFLQECTILF